MILLLAHLAALFGCARSIDPGKSAETGDASAVSAGDAVIDATSETAWTYLDLETAAVVTPDDPTDSTAWDLGFQRFLVAINGGVSGSGGMEAARLEGVDYNDEVDLPTSGWVTDEPDADDDGEPERALDDWYDYDAAAHALTPKDLLFLLKSVEGDAYKLQFVDYYDDAGTPGYVHVRWGGLDATATDDTGGDTGDGGWFTCSADASRVVSEDLGGGVTLTTVDSSNPDDWVCLSFAEGVVGEGWDLALQKWTFYTSAEVAALPGQDFDALTTAPADGYATDDPEGSVFEDWYLYDTDLHILVPDDVVYVLHTAADTWLKMKITTYYPPDDTAYEQPHHPAIQWAEVAAPGR